MPRLFDHLVGCGEQFVWDGDSERLGGLEVDHQLEFGGFLNWQLSWVRTLENTIHVTGSLLPEVEIIDSIGEQTTTLYKKAVWVDRWNPKPRGKPNDQFVVNRSSWTSGHD